MPHPEIPTTRPSPGTAVWLHGLSKTNLNGQRAFVLASVADGRAACPLAGGRCPVQLETSGSANISVKLLNLSLTPTEASDSTDANLWGPPEGWTNAPSVLVTSLPSRHGAHPGGLDPPFCIKAAGQAGLGVFATRFISAGDYGTSTVWVFSVFMHECHLSPAGLQSGLQITMSYSQIDHTEACAPDHERT